MIYHSAFSYFHWAKNIKEQEIDNKFASQVSENVRTTMNEHDEFETS